MLKNYIKIALRNLTKHKLYSSINIGGLALGMATAVLLMLWVYNEYSFDTYHKKAKNTYRITSHIKINKNETWHWGATPMLLADKLKQTYPEVSETARLFVPWDVVNLKVNNNLLSEDKLLYVDKNWFEIFDYKSIKGSFKDFMADKNNIAITQTKAKELFGEAEPIDKVIQLDSLNLVVKTVLSDYPPNTVFKYDILVQNEARLANKQQFENDNNWDNYNYQTYVVCNENTDVSRLEKKMTSLFQGLREDEEKSSSLALQPLSAMHYDSSIEIGDLLPPVSKNILLIFAGIAFLILLTACINYINLTTANVSLRNKEVSIKKFMGVSKSGLFYQFFAESALTSLLAMFLAIGLIYLGLPHLEAMVDNRFDISNNPLVWLILGVITILSILFNGIYPSALLANLKPLALIKGKSVVGTKNSTFRKILVVFQFSFTIILLICSSFIFKQLKFVQNKDLGYNKQEVFTIQIPWYADKSGSKSFEIFSQLQKESKITGVTRSSGDIANFNSTHSGSLDWDGKEKDWNPTVSPMSVTENYQPFFDLKLKSGRWFKANNSADDNNVILNETAVKEFQLKEPVVGKSFTYQGRTGQIIAIVKDFNFKSPKEKITPLLFHRDKSRLSTISIKANAQNVSGALATVERIWQSNITDLPFRYEFMDDTYAKLQKEESKQLQLFYTFGAIVLIISCIGLFGLATFAAETRIKEIGIRKVLGSSVIEIVNLLSKDLLKLVLIATLIASPVAWWLINTWLQNFAYHINIEWWVFILAGFTVALLAFITISYQSLKAAIANPVKSLKAE